MILIGSMRCRGNKIVLILKQEIRYVKAAWSMLYAYIAEPNIVQNFGKIFGCIYWHIFLWSNDTLRYTYYGKLLGVLRIPPRYINKSRSEYQTTWAPWQSWFFSPILSIFSGHGSCGTRYCAGIMQMRQGIVYINVPSISDWNYQISFDTTHCGQISRNGRNFPHQQCITNC